MSKSISFNHYFEYCVYRAFTSVYRTYTSKVKDVLMKKAVRMLKKESKCISNWELFFDSVIIPDAGSTKKGRAQRKEFKLRWGKEPSEL